MLQFSSMPSWNALHPFIIHFPIVLLLLTPLFIVISAALPPPRGRPYMIAAIFVLLLGNASLFIAISTGNAAAELTQPSGGVNAVLKTHKQLALETEIIFLELSAILLGIFLLPRLLCRRETRLFSTLLPLTFLVLYSVGILFLVNTAHNGGRLVHEFGVHVLIPATVDLSSATSAVEGNSAIEDRR